MGLVSQALDAMNGGILPYHPLKLNTGYPVVDHIGDKVVSSFFNAAGPAGELVQWLLEHAPVFEEKKQKPELPDPQGPYNNHTSHDAVADGSQGYYEAELYDASNYNAAWYEWNIDPIMRTGYYRGYNYHRNFDFNTDEWTRFTLLLVPFVCGALTIVRLYVDQEVKDSFGFHYYKGWADSYNLVSPPRLTGYDFQNRPLYDFRHMLQTYDSSFEDTPPGFLSCNDIVATTAVLSIDTVDGYFYPLGPIKFWFHISSHGGNPINRTDKRAALSVWLRNLRRVRGEFAYRIDAGIPPTWSDTFGHLQAPSWFHG